MNRSFRKRPNLTLSKSKKWWLYIATMLFLFASVFWLSEVKVREIMVALAKTEIKQAAQDAMLKSLSEVRSTIGENLSEVMVLEKGDKGKISSVRLDTALQTEIYTKLTSSIQDSLKELNGKNIKLQLGEVLHSTILSEYGPSIAFEIRPKGSAKISIIPTMESKGINMVAVGLNVKIYNEMVMIVPFSKEIIPISFDYPLAQTIIVGDVPNYYFNNDSNNNAKNIPILPRSISPIKD